jgi:putative nucleotidyltransferase with HDIG domain
VNAVLKTEESRLLAEAHAAVLEQSKKNEFEPAPYELATELLESLPPAEFVDDRVQLALDITHATRLDYRPDLSRRALYGAFPAGSELKNRSLKRKWFTFAGIIESGLGNVERALKYKLIALELCEQLKDAGGFCSEWMSFANLASGAGLYQEAAQYATVVIEAKGGSDPAWLHLRGSALLTRANALVRLGRYAEAESDVSSSLMSITYPPGAPVRNQIVFAQHLFADSRLECGDVSAARAALDAASTWAEACGVPQYKLQVERVLARLSARECGVHQAVSKLEKLLEQAHDLEAQLGHTSLDDIVLDVLHTLERVHREHSDTDGANEWLRRIGEKLRNNAAKMLDALSDKPLLADDTPITAKMQEIDQYLQSRATARPGTFGTADPSWMYLIGLAASATGAEDPTKEHGVRVARLANLVARELGLCDTIREGIEAGCLVHDVGKVSVPASILTKRTALNSGEQRLYEAHPDVGAELLERMKHPAQSVVRNVIRFHHHPYEGRTAHSQPWGDAIPLEARIASVCDEYDSLVAGRPRRPAISSSDALREVFGHRARKFDPKVVDVFVEVVRGLHRTHPDLQAYLAEEADSMEYFAMQRTLRRAAERALANQ